MRSLVVILVLLGIGGIFLMSGCSSYNSFVSMDEEVNVAWSNVQSAYQRRADLIPNLVNTVKGVAEFEKSTLTQVVEARAKATSINIDPSKATPEQLKSFQDAQAGLSQSLGRLLLVSENYPQLRASENFKELQAQLEGTENRIKVERDKFNKKVGQYNVAVRKLPGAIFAGMFGFQERAMFEAEAGAQEAPEVNF